MFSDLITPILKLRADTRWNINSRVGLVSVGVQAMADALHEFHGEVETDERKLRDSGGEDEAADETFGFSSRHGGRNLGGNLVECLVGDTHGALLEIP